MNNFTKKQYVFFSQQFFFINIYEGSQRFKLVNRYTPKTKEGWQDANQNRNKKPKCGAQKNCVVLLVLIVMLFSRISF